MDQHARAFDLPGWATPPRVRDIPNHEESWGWVPVSAHSGVVSVAIDGLGYLWANGDAIPAFRMPRETDANPGAIVCWSESGLTLWVHPKSLGFIPSISRLDMKPDEWIPVALALAELPPFVKAA
jgi:hypothetical protein